MQRGISVKSDDVPENEKQQILEAEERAKGNLKFSVLIGYLSSVQSYALLFLVLAILVLTQATGTFTDYWLSAL
jgi:hypothetical protein